MSEVIGNAKEHKGKGIICFLDILGAKNEIKNNWDDPNPKENPLERLLRMKNDLITEVENAIPGELFYQDTGKTFRKFVLKYSSISDSFIIGFGLNSKALIGDSVMGLIFVFISAINVWRKAIKEGFTIRGAIDYGDIYWKEQDIIGPAFINAYELESLTAKTSRIIISSDLNKFINSLLNESKGKIDKFFLPFLKKDIDGYLIINSKLLLEKNNKPENDLLIEKLKDMREKISDKIVREKYTPLINILLEPENPNIDIKDIGNY